MQATFDARQFGPSSDLEIFCRLKLPEPQRCAGARRWAERRASPQGSLHRGRLSSVFVQVGLSVTSVLQCATNSWKRAK
jgi:hypothetical protein